MIIRLLKACNLLIELRSKIHLIFKLKYTLNAIGNQLIILHISLISIIFASEKQKRIINHLNNKIMAGRPKKIVFNDKDLEAKFEQIKTDLKEFNYSNLIELGKYLNQLIDQKKKELIAENEKRIKELMRQNDELKG